MKQKTLVLVACCAWIAVALSTATPANADAITTQSGLYATCSGTYTAAYADFACGSEALFVQTNYNQIMRFVNTNCNTGTCSADTLQVAVQSVYPTGRKTAHQDSTCFNSKRKYSLGTCAC
jgi:hypothetical protein